MDSEDCQLRHDGIRCCGQSYVYLHLVSKQFVFWGLAVEAIQWMIRSWVVFGTGGATPQTLAVAACDEAWVPGTGLQVGFLRFHLC
jgi:hypothetical protein